jgi:hypothetical protein
LIINEFSGLKFHCTADQYVDIDNGKKICPIVSGDKVIDNLGFSNLTVGWSVFALFVITFVFRLLGYLALRFLAKKK